MLIGALAQSFPDIDFVGAFFLNTSDNILAHRGITHSILFSVVATILLAKGCAYYFRKLQVSQGTWLLLIGLNIFTHIFIDAFNAYGTGWLLPFSNKRISFHTLFVADPLFTFWPLIACIVLFFSGHSSQKRKRWWQAGLGISLLYLVVSMINKQIVASAVEEAMVKENIKEKDFLTTPGPFNTLLWFVAIKSGNGFYTGYHSVFDKDRQMTLTYHPKNDALLREVADTAELKDLLIFADDFYTVEKWHDTTVLNVLRFGQVVGWHDPKEKFVFHYFLDKPGANTLVTQRGRFERWNKETIGSLWKGIKGD